MLYQIEIKKILKMRKRGKSVDDIAKETGHSKTTVTKYLKQPIKQYAQRNWRTRQNPFDEVKEEIKEMFRVNPTLEGTSLLEHLIEKHPGKFIEGHLRSLQRYLKILRAEIGPDKEVIFPYNAARVDDASEQNAKKLQICVQKNGGGTCKP